MWTKIYPCSQYKLIQIKVFNCIEIGIRIYTHTHMPDFQCFPIKALSCQHDTWLSILTRLSLFGVDIFQALVFMYSSAFLCCVQILLKLTSQWCQVDSQGGSSLKMNIFQSLSYQTNLIKFCHLISFTVPFKTNTSTVWSVTSISSNFPTLQITLCDLKKQLAF